MGRDGGHARFQAGASDGIDIFRHLGVGQFSGSADAGARHSVEVRPVVTLLSRFSTMNADSGYPLYILWFCLHFNEILEIFIVTFEGGWFGGIAMIDSIRR